MRTLNLGNKQTGFNFQKAGLEGCAENGSQGAQGIRVRGNATALCPLVGTVAVGIERNNCGHGGVWEH